MFLRFWAAWSITQLACFAGSQEPALHGVLENYWLTRPSTKGIGERLAWLQMDLDAIPNVGFVNTFLLMPSKNLLDETYIRYDSGLTQVRAGRFRSGFGFSQWSDFYYDAIIAQPLVRSSRVDPYKGLSRLDTGVDVRTVLGQFEVQAGLVDTGSASFQWTPKEMNCGVVRLQTNLGPLILGASAISKLSRFGDRDFQAYGLDFRWTADRVQVRGEYIQASSPDGGSSGGYVDGFYRPPGFFRTQLGARLQNFHSFDGSDANLATLGLRQILTSELAATLNYGFGRGAAGSSLEGWSFEVSTFFHF